MTEFAANANARFTISATCQADPWIDEFFDCLATSTMTQPRLEEAVAVKENQLPAKIYKYRRDEGTLGVRLEPLGGS
jgi:hypothetical protein